MTQTGGAKNTFFFSVTLYNFQKCLAIFFIWAIVVGVFTVQCSRLLYHNFRNTEEDTEDKTEIVVKKMRIVISKMW